jgi:hypothetical protein
MVCLIFLILVRHILRCSVRPPFFNETLPIGSTKVLRDKHKFTAAGSGEIKQRPNKDEIRNEDTEKNEDPRLLQIGRKDTRKDDQRLKQVTRRNLGYGDTKNPKFF